MVQTLSVSKNDLELWIDRFVSDISRLRSEKAIQKRCESELEKLRKALGIAPNLDEEGIAQSYKGKVNTMHTYLTQYKNVVTDRVTLTNSNSYSQTIGKFKAADNSGSRRKKQFHYVHRYLKLSRDESALRRQQIKNSSDTKRRNPRYFYSDEAISKALDLLKSDYFSHITLGLILLTGRRPSEILKTAKFEPIDSQTVMFSGQLKTRDCPTAKTYPFPIPVLADAKIICDALARLREMPEIKSLADKPVKACNAKASVLGEVCDRHFGTIIKDCIPHDLRSAYAQICLVYRRPDRDKRTDYEPYFAEILGHAEDDLDTSKKYKKFELFD